MLDQYPILIEYNLTVKTLILFFFQHGSRTHDPANESDIWPTEYINQL